MTFHFRFESILQLRRRQRDEAGAAVGQANQAVAKVDEQIGAIETLRQELREGSGEQRVGNISVDSLLAGGRYDLQLQSDQNGLKNTRAELLQEVDRRQQRLIEAEAEVKRMEKLKAREEEAHRAAELRREQVASDEATAQRYIYGRQR